MTQLLPLGERTDPIADTWRRGLIATALEQQLHPLYWHIEHNEHGSTATGYVTVSLLHEANTIRAAWAQQLGLISDDANGYTGQSAGLTIALPDVINPAEHCRVCGHAFDPRDLRPAGRKRSTEGDMDMCRSCATS